ncbi:unnamed protein product, partial [Rotaria socialis]
TQKETEDFLLNDSQEDDCAFIESNIGRVLHFNGEWNEALKYYDLAHDEK